MPTRLAVILDSIVVSIPACHAGDRGSIPRRGDNILVKFILVDAAISCISIVIKIVHSIENFGPIPINTSAPTFEEKQRTLISHSSLQTCMHSIGYCLCDKPSLGHR